MEKNLLDKSYILFECIKVVHGLVKSTLIDLNRKQYYEVSREFAQTLIDYNGKKLGELCDVIDFDNEAIIGFLTENELIFFDDEIQTSHFPPISLEFNELPLYHCEVDFEIVLNHPEFIQQMESLGCKILNIYISENATFDQSNEITLNLLNEILKQFDESSINFILLFIPRSAIHSIAASLDEVFLSFPRLHNLIVYNSDSDMVKNHPMIYTTHSLEELMQGELDKSFITPSILLFVESQSYNPYYNRRIYINKERNIYATYNSEIQYDTHAENLQSAITSSEYQQLIKITKDQISECKDCIYRYMCTDSRVPVLKEEEYSHETGCPVYEG
ncbi:MAG: hypothetical protein KDD63_13965 [Bacteroidetes bacterium]|nr:hypothetical protein [Bacteroidota bacterium]